MSSPQVGIREISISLIGAGPWVFAPGSTHAFSLLVKNNAGELLYFSLYVYWGDTPVAAWDVVLGISEQITLTKVITFSSIEESHKLIAKIWVPSENKQLTDIILGILTTKTGAVPPPEAPSIDVSSLSWTQA